MKKQILSLALTASMVLTAAAIPAASAEESTKLWSENRTANGWTMVTNEGGETLGYSKSSGVTILEVDGYAFKDMNRNGQLDTYEDWRLDDETRARALADSLSVEEMTPLFTHGGWSSFGSTIEGTDLEYVQAGGRGGVTRSAASSGNTTMAVDWVNALQTLCESTGNWGIPATISVDPANIAGTIDQTGLAATMDTELAFELGKMHGKMYRSVGITMLLGPMISIGTQPTMARSSQAYSEDPALNRDLADAYISGLQSTWAEDGTDLGWGVDSVYAIAKHYVGDGACEGGRNDHFDGGRSDVFPGNNFAAHLIPFFDGAFNLTRSITGSSGVMPNYAMSYSEDGSLGELMGGAYSSYKIGLLKENGFEGFILTDWQITDDGGAGSYTVTDLTVAERFALLYKNGIHQVGGTSDVEGAAAGYELVVEELGSEEAEKILRDAVYHFILTQMEVGLYENPYVDLDNAIATVYTNETDAIAKEQKLQTIMMLKNDGVIAQNNGEMKTVYVPMTYSAGSGASSSGAATPASWSASMDTSIVSKNFNVVTDTVGEPTGDPDEDGNATYTENDIIRASSEEIAACDFILVPMSAPNTDSEQDSEGNWLPASIQYGEYTATNAREVSIGKDTGNRSYQGNTVGKSSNYSSLELLQYVYSVKGDAKVLVLMSNSSGSAQMVWSEVEPLCDAILYYYGSASSYTEVLMEIAAGNYEPSALLPYQQPASMEAVEAQYEDVPRDVECYVDADGHAYDFAYGLNWSGVINDERVQTYSVEPLTTPSTITFHYANEEAAAE